MSSSKLAYRWRGKKNAKAIFLNNEGRNHIYNAKGISSISYQKEGKNYFNALDGEFAAAFVSGGDVVLARDRFGQVPLHYMITGDGSVLAANEIKQLMKNPEYNYRHVRAVRAGHVVTIPLAGRFTEKDIREERYADSFYGLGPTEGFIEEWGKEIHGRLVGETEKRLNSCYNTYQTALALSGGIDSFSVALAVAELGRIRDVEAYCINTKGRGSDWPNAQKAAKYLGMKLNEVRASSQRTLDIIPDVIYLAELYKDYDIFCAAACYLLGEEMQKHGVSNIFTGDGANECFRDYTSWGCFAVDREKIVTQEMGARILEGRRDSDPVRSPQLGDGYAKSASRGSKIFPYFGIDAFNPFIASSVAAYIAKIPLEGIAQWDASGQPLWKKRIMQAAFPAVPEELFPLKTRMQDGVGTTDVICNIRRSDLLHHGRENGFARYGRGALDKEFQVQNPYYYTDLFRGYFENIFISKTSPEEAGKRWSRMLEDLELAPGGRSWKMVEMSQQK